MIPRSHHSMTIVTRGFLAGRFGGSGSIENEYSNMIVINNKLKLVII